MDRGVVDGLKTPRPSKLPKYLTLTEVIKKKIDAGERAILAYYDPKIEEVRERIRELNEELRELEGEREQSLEDLMQANAKPMYTDDLCQICWMSAASESLPCCHTMCSECRRKLTACPWDRRPIL